MAKNNMTCFLCGTGYRYCPSCLEYKNKPSWYKLFHSEQCKNIDSIVVAYNNKKIGAEEAKEKLLKEKADKLNIKDIDIKNNISDILSYKKEVKIVEPVSEKKVETNKK